MSTTSEVGGLKPIARIVHMPFNLDKARNSNTNPVKIVVDIIKTRQFGITIYQAANDVVLSYSKIPLECLTKEYV